MLVQNYGWPIGRAKIWLWLARRPFGWPRASGKHDPCCTASVDSRKIIDLLYVMNVSAKVCRDRSKALHIQLKYSDIKLIAQYSSAKGYTR